MVYKIHHTLRGPLGHPPLPLPQEVVVAHLYPHLRDHPAQVAGVHWSSPRADTYNYAGRSDHNLQLARRETSIFSESALGSVFPTAICRGFCQTSTTHSGSPRRPFFKPSSATGSASRHLHHGCPWATFHPEPPGRPFFISWPGTHAHCHIYLIHVHICYSLQILFTLGIWLFCVQVLDSHHHGSAFLQVYILSTGM
jgi:hypothetical protein